MTSVVVGLVFCNLFNKDELVKSRKVRHCEQSEAISWIITVCNYWIPAFAGMTVKGYIRLFTKPSIKYNKDIFQQLFMQKYNEVIFLLINNIIVLYIIYYNIIVIYLFFEHVADFVK